MPSLNTPCASNCFVCPEATENDDGTIEIEDRVGVFTGEGLTTSAIEPAIVPCVAVTVTEPAFKAVTKPELLIVATETSELCQLTWEVNSCVLLSEYVP